MSSGKRPLSDWWKDPCAESVDVTRHLLRFADGELEPGEDDEIIALMLSDPEFRDRVGKTLEADAVIEGLLAHEAASARRFNEGLVVIAADISQRPPSVTPIRTPEGLHLSTYVAWSGDPEEASCCRWTQPDGVTVAVYVGSASRYVAVRAQGLPPGAAPPSVTLTNEGNESFSPVVEAESADRGRSWTASFRDLAPGEYRLLVPPTGRALAGVQRPGDGDEVGTRVPTAPEPCLAPGMVWALARCVSCLPDELFGSSESDLEHALRTLLQSRALEFEDRLLGLLQSPDLEFEDRLLGLWLEHDRELEWRFGELLRSRSLAFEDRLRELSRSRGLGYERRLRELWRGRDPEFERRLREFSHSGDREFGRRLRELEPPPTGEPEPGPWDVVLGADIRPWRSSVVPILIPEGVHPVALAAGPGDPEDSRGIELSYPSGMRVTVYASSESRNVRVWVRGVPPTAPPPRVMLSSEEHPSSPVVVEAELADGGYGWTACFRDLDPGEYRVTLPPIEMAAPGAPDAGEDAGEDEGGEERPPDA